MTKQMMKLGDKVRDTVSGFEGVAVARTEYLNGCARVGVQPPVDKDGKLPEAHHFDEPQLEVVLDQEAVSAHDADDRTGGPTRYPDQGRDIVDPGR